LTAGVLRGMVGEIDPSSIKKTAEEKEDDDES
jgi:hypothetical protein